jgi:D-glycero-D-manno-heptose 1,7-bisphosphate phosphatase
MAFEMTRRAVFLDLNGTLVLPVIPQDLSELTLIDNAGQAVARLNQQGFICPIVTVQSRINKGAFTLGEFQQWFGGFASTLNALGAEVVGPYVCPHRYREPCECKKPSTFLYEQAARDYGINLPQSFVIGDSPEDVCAAYRFYGRGCLVRTGLAIDDAVLERALPFTSFIARSLDEAVDWVLAQDSISGLKS